MCSNFSPLVFLGLYLGQVTNLFFLKMGVASVQNGGCVYKVVRKIKHLSSSPYIALLFMSNLQFTKVC